MTIVNMERLLIGTRNKLIVWDKKARTILEKKRYYVYHHFYGISWDTKDIYVAHRLTYSHGAIDIFDNEFNLKKQVSFDVDFYAPHQILWWDKKLYMTDAHLSRVLVWDKKNVNVVEWRRPDGFSLHVNSIWCDGKKFYVLEHRGAVMPKGIQVFDLDFNPIKHIELPRKVFVQKKSYHGVHNVYIEDGILYVFSPGALVKYNLAFGDFKHVIPHPMLKDYYARGLARTEGRFFIGLSEVKTRAERDKGDSFILVTDDDFNVLDVLTLKDTGALHEIRAIDSPDWAHNKIRCPLLDGKKIHYNQKKAWLK